MDLKLINLLCTNFVLNQSFLGHKVGPISEVDLDLGHSLMSLQNFQFSFS